MGVFFARPDAFGNERVKNKQNEMNARFLYLNECVCVCIRDDDDEGNFGR